MVTTKSKYLVHLEMAASVSKYYPNITLNQKAITMSAAVVAADLVALVVLELH